MEEKLLEEWQERLGLQDWIIVLRYNCKCTDLQDPTNTGENEWTNCVKSAIIRIISKEEYGDRIVDYDFEKTLVHELLHIKFGLLDITKENVYEAKVVDEVRHQLLDDLAMAMIMAKRGITKRPMNKECKKVKDMYERS